MPKSFKQTHEKFNGRIMSADTTKSQERENVLEKCDHSMSILPLAQDSDEIDHIPDKGASSMIKYHLHGRTTYINEHLLEEKRTKCQRVIKNRTDLIIKQRYFGTYKQQRYCYHCRRRGHWTNECKIKLKFILGVNNDDSRSEVICKRCNFAGHLDHECRQMRRCQRCHLLQNHSEE